MCPRRWANTAAPQRPGLFRIRQSQKVRTAGNWRLLRRLMDVSDHTVLGLLPDPSRRGIVRGRCFGRRDVVAHHGQLGEGQQNVDRCRTPDNCGIRRPGAVNWLRREIVWQCAQWLRPADCSPGTARGESPRSSFVHSLATTVLKLRPNCECCDRDLPPDSEVARICSFECTFCAPCADTALKGVCPNCGGELVPRPRRPAAKLDRFPASTERVHKSQGCDQAGSGQ